MLIIAFYTAIIGYGKQQSILGLRAKKKHEEIEYYKRIGWLIMIASLVYMIYTTRLFMNNQNISYDKVPALIIATITFSEIAISSYGIMKAHRNNQLMQKAVKLLNLSSSLIGLVLTQTALLSISSEYSHPIANAFSGLFLGSITLFIGIQMTLKKAAPDRKKRINNTLTLPKAIVSWEKQYVSNRHLERDISLKKQLVEDRKLHLTANLLVKDLFYLRKCLLLKLKLTLEKFTQKNQKSRTMN